MMPLSDFGDFAADVADAVPSPSLEVFHLEQPCPAQIPVANGLLDRPLSSAVRSFSSFLRTDQSASITLHGIG